MNGVELSDLFYGAALFVNAALFLPQAYKIFINKNFKDISLITFGGFNIIQLLGFINGVYNHDYALIVGQAISFITCGLITLQVIIYKTQRLVSNVRIKDIYKS